MRLFPVGSSIGHSESKGRYDYNVYYCSELETFYTVGRWGSNIANPFSMPKAPSELPFKDALYRIRVTLKEVYRYMECHYPQWKWRSAHGSGLYEALECEWWDPTDEATDPEHRPLKVVNKMALEETDMIEVPESDWVECDCCGQLVPPHHISYDNSGNAVCDDCYDDVVVCADCGDFIIAEDDRFEVHVRHRYTRTTQFVCESCLERNYFCCSDCGEYYHLDLREMSDDENDICEDCSDRWHVCYDCGTLIPADESYYNEDNGEYYCDSCWGNRHYCIRNYSYKPEPIFHKAGNENFDASSMSDPLYMGVELEIDNGRDSESCVRGIMEGNEDIIYIKHDGSLNNGMELVTHPSTLLYHMESFPWEDIMSTALSHNYRSHDTSTCGLHVHVNRTALGITVDQREATIAKIALLMERFWDTLVKFSRRDYNQLHWCKKMDLDVSPDSDSDQELINKIAKNRTCSHDDRYYALNLINRNTIEFRIFRGTLNYKTFIATLQLVHNMVNWARVHTVRETLKCSWFDFALCEEFTELKEYMESRSITDTEGGNVGLPPTTFKVGDMVRVRPDLEAWEAEANIGWLVEEMYEYAGRTFRVEMVERDPDFRFDSPAFYRLSDMPSWKWGEDALLPV